MRLLVSVRSEAEAVAALKGGADIIDAKDPARGSLGAVAPSTLVEIARAVPLSVPLSIALGDLGTPSEVSNAVRAIELPIRSAPTYVKIGFAGATATRQLSELITAAVTAGRRNGHKLSIVAVAYADHERAGAPVPDTVARVAALAGACGILIDTHAKDGLDLFSWIGATELGSWCARQHAAGLLTALAGSISGERLGEIWSLGPDIVGVRGAACEGGREGRVSATRVARLRQAMRSLGSRPRPLRPCTADA